ncbi:hypothetical protein BU16DRAFT_28421 [Lophium mytilinum]|uniref:Aminoglycoside phosphotransferase domain-containing protein n=1 Tax=Lophium mytilinum TaxID=390894 RepID=A0A6A6RF88_9PEZI|nr:hypothetical protein BU16DRAFT_28421 [Lophium mytilinum]
MEAPLKKVPAALLPEWISDLPPPVKVQMEAREKGLDDDTIPPPGNVLAAPLPEWSSDLPPPPWILQTARVNRLDDDTIPPPRRVPPAPPSLLESGLPRPVMLQMGARINRLDDDTIGKSGSRVRPREEAAMRLVAKHTDVLVPDVQYSTYNEVHGDLFMSIIPGSPLSVHWEKLDDQTKERVCHDIWNLIGKFRQIPKPPELNNFFLCSADGSCSQDVFIEDLESPPRPLVDDDAVRTRISERYYHYYGRRYTKEEILSLLPHSQASVFTHCDIAPRNIMVDDHTYQITGLIDWEFAGWYPDYWEYLRIHKYNNNEDWRDWMNRTAPQKWDLAGFVAVSRVLF